MLDELEKLNTILLIHFQFASKCGHKLYFFVEISDKNTFTYLIYEMTKSSHQRCINCNGTPPSWELAGGSTVHSSQRSQTVIEHNVINKHKCTVIVDDDGGSLLLSDSCFALS